MTSEKISFSPFDMARITREKKQAENGEITTPHEGDIIELEGAKFQFLKVPTGEKVWDSSTQSLVPGYHSLKTWFSHPTEKVGPGPGWDHRMTLMSLSPEEMMQRYGHVFTRDEVLAPGGRREGEFGEEMLVGGMPDDIPYYELYPLQAAEQNTLEEI